ncbi:signal peptidase II [uncultured Neptuniibacter sp.]|uniref:signal peptidase II n=1 Tax=uncultured Neptuniibacter sp. TaxID=502143 RepID=UPI00262DDC62|nr:signal peptidase II [uncultured Neptuniibacter sp.]
MSDLSENQKPDQGHCLIWGWLSLLIVLLDLGSKQLAVNYLQYGDPNPVIPFFDLTLLFNTGAAFSFLSEAGGWQRWFFVLIAVVVSVVLVVWLRRTPRIHWWLGLGLALILGGAIGNLYDRAVQGYVIDFISLHYGDYYFPAFNLADTAITIGAFILILDMLFLERKRSHSQEKSE